MSMLQKLVMTAMGRDSAKEDEQKKKADAGVAQYEQETGEEFVDEPGIEEDTTIEDAGLAMATGPAAGMAKRLGSMAVGKASKAGLEKVKEKGMPSALGRKAWHELSEKERSDYPGGFAAFVREFDKTQKNAPVSAVSQPAKANKPAGTVDLGKYWEKQDSTPMKKTEATTGFKPRKNLIIIDK